MKTNYIKMFKMLFLIASFYPSVIVGQITFQKIYPSAIRHESGKDVIETSDGGYIIASSTETNVVNDLDIMIMRTNSVGDILWKKAYGGSLPEIPNSILKASDGNYFIVGYTQSAGSGDYDHFLLKINPVDGALIYSRNYGGYGNEESKEIIPTSDGNYVIVGASNSVTFSDNNMQLIKIDPSGTVIWTRNYGGLDYESARSVKECSDGGFIVAGKTINTSKISKVQLVRTNSAGVETWTKSFGSTNSLEAKSILVNNDGSYTLAVDDSSDLPDSDVRIMKIDADGNTVIWSKLYGGTEKDICKMIKPTSDGGYIVTAMGRSFGWIEPDYWILRLNAIGDTLWTRHFGGIDHEHCYAAKQTSDGGYIVVGHTRSNNQGRIEEILLIKLNTNGNVTVGLNEYALNDNTLMVYPNPSSGIININLTGEYESGSIFKVVNTLGQTVFSEAFDQSNRTMVLNLQVEKRGIYFITVQSKDGIATKKLILQ